jgi:hypothetical protein
MVETPRQIWTVRFKEATCREINHIEKPGIENSGVPWSRVRSHVMISPDEWTRFFQRISGSITTVRCEEEMSTLRWGVNAP